MKKNQNEILSFELNNRFVSTPVYAAGMNEALNHLAPHISYSQRKDLCFRKLALESGEISEQSFIQYAVELTVCAHFANLFPADFIYEEKVNPPKDVDCTVRVGGYKYNLEVKCADFTKKEAVDESEGFKIGALGRLSDYAEVVADLQKLFLLDGHPLSAQRHMDNNLKDFLISAHGKFSPGTSEDELNVLVVGCDDAMDMQKWHSYLYGVQGLFTDESYADKSTYSRVDLVLLTNLYHRHKNPASKDKLTGHWKLSDAFCLLCANPYSGKPYKTAYEFSKTVRHHNNEWNDYMVGEEEPDFILKGIGIPAYVVSQLQANGIYYFQPSETQMDDQGDDQR